MFPAGAGWRPSVVYGTCLGAGQTQLTLGFFSRKQEHLFLGFGLKAIDVTKPLSTEVQKPLLLEQLLALRTCVLSAEQVTLW